LRREPGSTMPAVLYCGHGGILRGVCVAGVGGAMITKKELIQWRDELTEQVRKLQEGVR